MFEELKKDHLNLAGWLIIGILLGAIVGLLLHDRPVALFAGIGMAVAAAVYTALKFFGLLLASSPGRPLEARAVVRTLNGLIMTCGLLAIFAAGYGARLPFAALVLVVAGVCFSTALVVWKRYPQNDEPFTLAVLAVLPFIGLLICYSEANYGGCTRH